MASWLVCQVHTPSKSSCFLKAELGLWEIYIMHNGLWADTGAGRQHSRMDPRLSREAAKAKASGKGPTDCSFLFF